MKNKPSKASHVRSKKFFSRTGKRLLYSAAILGTLGGGITLLPNAGDIIAYALTLPSGVEQVGTINGAPVLKATTNNLSSKEFTDIIGSLVEEMKTPPVVVNQVSWNSKTSLYNGSNLESFGESPRDIFGADGFLPTDKAIKLLPGETAYIENVGSALDTKTNKDIPLSLGITFMGAKSPAGNALPHALLGAKSQGGVITLAWGSNATKGDAEGEGGSEGGSTGGSSTDDTAMRWIREVSYRVSLINSDTGDALPDDTLMPIKMSDIDASQLATMGGEGALGYILSNDTALSQSGNGFKSTSNGAIEEDSTKLTENSYLVLKQWNKNTVQYQYTDNIDNHMDIVTGMFGNTPWNLSDILGGYIEIDKSTSQYGKDEWNGHYGFEGIKFDVVDADGKVVDTITLDENGKGKSKQIPSGKYTLREKSSNWSSTGQTVRDDTTVTVKPGETIKADIENTAVTGQITINKSLKDFGKNLPNGSYSFEGIQFKVTSSDGKYSDTITLDKNGKATTKKLPLGKYKIEEVASSVDKGTGQLLNTKTYEAELTYKDQNTEIVLDSSDVVNTPVMGQITVNKSLTDYGKTLPNSLYGFEGIQFKVTSADGKYSDTITLDKNGKATTKKLPLGKYKVEEIASSVDKDTGQITNTKTYNAELTYKDQTTEIVLDTSDVVNTPVLGQITIEKKGVESGTDLWNERYSLKGNVFKLTSLTDGKTYEITTNEQGIAKTNDKMPLGKYEIEEIKSSDGFVNTFKKTTVELTWKNNTTALVFDDATGTNQEIKGQNTLEKEDKDTGKDQHGKADMVNAEYALYYGDDATGSSAHKKGDPVKWSDIPKAELLSGEKVTESLINGEVVEHGDNVVINVDDDKLNVAIGNLSLGKYFWKEINAPEGYVLDQTEHPFELVKKDDKTENIVAPETNSKEQIIQAKITIQKLAEILGESAESGYNGVEFTVTPLEGTVGDPITMKTGVNPTTDEDGYAMATLPYGDYIVQETKGIPGYDNIKDIYIHMVTDTEKDLLTISASNNKDFTQPFSKRTFSITDNVVEQNPNGEEAGSIGDISSDKAVISLSKMTFTDKTTPNIEKDPEKDVTKTDGGDSINHGDVGLSSDFVYVLRSSEMHGPRESEAKNWSILDDYDETTDSFNGTYDVYALTDFGEFKAGDVLPAEYFKAEDKDGKVNFEATDDFLTAINENKEVTIQYEIRADFFREKPSDKVENVFTETKNDHEEDSNVVDTKTPEPIPHKFDLKGNEVHLTDDELLDDDSELDDRYADTAKDPYVDQTDNNQAENWNTKTVLPGDELNYQLWLDTTPFDETSELTVLSMEDDFDETKLDVDAKNVKVYDSEGKDVTENFKVEIDKGLLKVSANVFKEVENTKGEKVKVVDTKKVPLGDYYKIEFLTKVKEDIEPGSDIVNSAKQITVDSNHSQLDHPTESRVNPVGDPQKPQKDVTKTDGGDSINGNRVALSSSFVYELDSSVKPGDREPIEKWTILDDYDENFDRFEGTFAAYATRDFGEYKAGDKLPSEFFKAEDRDGKVLFTAQDTFLKVVNENSRQEVGFSIHADFYRFEDSDKVLNTFVETINDHDEESNEVQTSTPTPTPHKFDLSKGKYDLEGNKLLDDDSEMKDRYEETNKNPYADKKTNNEKENMNTDNVKSGSKIHYQLWMDTTPFDETSELTDLTMTDTFDSKALKVSVDDIRVYNAKGKDVTDNFRIKVDGAKVTVTANVFAKAKNSEGKEVSIIDTKKIPLGDFYKIEMPMTVKDGLKDGYEIVNVANQSWKDSNDLESKHVTEKRVNKVKEKATKPSTSEPKKPEASKPNPKGVMAVLPKLGEGATKLSVVAMGIAMISGVGVAFWKRMKQSKASK